MRSFDTHRAAVDGGIRAVAVEALRVVDKCEPAGMATPAAKLMSSWQVPHAARFATIRQLLACGVSASFSS